MSQRTRRTRTRTPITTDCAQAARASAFADSAAGDSSMQLLRLLHLSSPALPIGSFHFSQGLEYAVDSGWVTDEHSAREWIGGIAEGSLATLDLPVLHRLHAAWKRDDGASVREWNAFIIACRETHELRLEDRHLGGAMLRVLAEFDITTELFPVGALNTLGVSHATAFALACARWRIDSLAAMQAYAWAWTENQVLAAVKLVPLGQSAGQRILHALTSKLAVHASIALGVMDSDIGVSTSLAAVASGRHETQYTRLFRS
jgi:urease accessory protein